MGYQISTAEAGMYARVEAENGEDRYELVVAWRVDTATGGVEPVTVVDVVEEFHEIGEVREVLLSKDIPQAAREYDQVFTGWNTDS